MGLFVAGEGRRSTAARRRRAAAPHRAHACGVPVGVAGLLISFNTPLPNVAWKAFPSLLCGNASVAEAVRAHARLGVPASRGSAHEAGLPAGRAQRRPGARRRGRRGARRAPATSTSSASPARRRPGAAINETRRRAAREGLPRARRQERARRLRRRRPRPRRALGARLGFSNAGQRCAAASRIIVFDAVYDAFRERLVEARRARSSREPVISEASLERILGAVGVPRGAARRCSAAASASTGRGWFIAPTVLEGAAPDAEVSCDRAVRAR